MKTNKDDFEAKAFALGYEASKNSKTRVPAYDIKLNEMFKDHKFHIIALIALIDAWQAGYERFVDEEIAKIFPNDQYFQAKITEKV